VVPAIERPLSGEIVRAPGHTLVVMLRRFSNTPESTTWLIMSLPEPFPRLSLRSPVWWPTIWKVVFDVRGGVTARSPPPAAEILDYITTFPRTQLVPAPHNTARGLFQQRTPLFGMSYTFR
jgi:hypothetical protein